MGDAIARGVVTDPLVTSSPATQGITSGKVTGPPGGVTPPPPVASQDASAYEVKQSAGNPENIGGSFRYDWDFKSDGTKAYTQRNGASASSSFREYDVSPAWSITPGDWSFVSSVLVGGANARTFQWSPDGTVLCTLQRWFSSNYRLINYDQSATPWASAVLGSATVGTNISTASFGLRWRPDGLVVYVDHNGGLIDALTVGVAFDASTLTTTPLYTFDSQVDAGVRSAEMAFSANGDRLYSVTSANLLCSWDLATPYDLSTASNFVTGVSVVLPTPLQVPRGIIYRNDTGDIFLERDQSTQNVRCWKTKIPSTDTLLIDDGGDALLIDDATSDNRLIED